MIVLALLGCGEEPVPAPVPEPEQPGVEDTAVEDTGQTHTGDSGYVPVDILEETCHPSLDPDEDGLSDESEAILGTDPLVPDTDGDGLFDSEEDSDSDTYTDGEELCAGTDPLDAASVIYTGGWPYYSDKDSIDGGELPGTIAAGERFGRFLLVDQFGETVDLFDFYNADRPVVIQLVASWTPPAREMSRWIAGGPDEIGFGQLWSAGPEVVARGDVYWLTVIYEDDSGAPAMLEDAQAWADDFPSPVIPVLADENRAVADYLAVEYIPTLAALRPDLTVEIPPPDQGYSPILLALDELFPF